MEFLFAQGWRGRESQFLFYEGMGPTLIVEGDMLYSKFTSLNVNLIQKLPSTETPRKLFDQILRHPSPVGPTYKINHSSDQ